jgi:hypothetical protein
MFQLILELVTTPAVILGLMALVGLLVQRKSAGEVISGTLKTILGLLIMSVGIGALINALVPIEKMFTQAFKIEGFVTFDEACDPLEVHLPDGPHDLDPCRRFRYSLPLLRPALLAGGGPGFHH